MVLPEKLRVTIQVTMGWIAKAIAAVFGVNLGPAHLCALTIGVALER